jgi:hypothetical protein
LAAVVVYLLSYFVLSCCGQYTVANHGGSDWTREWLPKCLMVDYIAFSGRTKSCITSLGLPYAPLILLDRLIWHRTTEAQL